MLVDVLVQPVSIYRTLSFDVHHPSFRQFVLVDGHQHQSRGLRHLDLVRRTVRLHSGCEVHGIPEETESRSFQSDDTCSDGAAVVSDSDLELPIRQSFYLVSVRGLNVD